MPSSPPDAFAATLVSRTRPRSSAPPRSSTPGDRVAILVGQGARGAATEVEQVADVLGAGVAKALLGKDVLPDDLPFVTGSIGLLGTRPSYELMRDCDTLLIVGSNFPYSQFLPEFGKARAVQIDLDGALIGMRYPTEVNLVADARRDVARAAAAAGAARPTGRGGRRSSRTSPTGGPRSSGRAWSTPTR